MSFMIKTLTILSILHSWSYAKKPENLEVRILARIESSQKSFKIYKEKNNDSIPFILSNKNVAKVLKNLKKNEDVILIGHIFYKKISIENKIKLIPVFSVHEIIPISLEKIGKVDEVRVEKKDLLFQSLPEYTPKGLTVSGATVGTITLTASILLLKSLTQPKSGINLQKQGENLTLFSMGALATGAQIFEDLLKNK